MTEPDIARTLAEEAERFERAKDEADLADRPVRPSAELRDSGLLWLINRHCFHPRGFALGLQFDHDGRLLGWRLLGDGSEPWVFEGDEDANFAAAEQTLREARDG